MDTTKELEETSSSTMEDGMEKLSKKINPEVDTPIQLEEQLNILKETEIVKDEQHAKMEVENDGQATIIAQEDTGSLCLTSLKINRKVTSLETKSQTDVLNLRKCNKFIVNPDCQKRKTVSLQRNEVLALAIKPFLHLFQQQDLSGEKNKFQPELQNDQEDKSRIVIGDLTKSDSIAGFPTKSPLTDEALFKPVSKKRVLGYDNLSSSISQSTYASDVEDEESGNAAARDTETKSDNFGDFPTKLASIKVNPMSANQFKEVSISENQLSSFSQSSSAPLTTLETTTNSQPQKIKSPEEVWANFESNLKTSSESTALIAGGATRQNVEALESMDDGFTDSTKQERASTGKNLGNFVNSKRQSVDALESTDDDFKDPTKQERDFTGKNFGNFANSKTQSVDALESTNDFKDPRKRERDFTGKNFGNFVNGEKEKVATQLPSDDENEISITRYGTEFIHPYENSLSRFSQSAFIPVRAHAKTTKSHRVKSAEEVWTHFRLHLTANMESFDRIFAYDSRRENVETSESVYPSLKGPTTTVKNSASPNLGERVMMKTEIATTEIQKDVKSKRPRTLNVTQFINSVRAHFLKRALEYEKILKTIQENRQEESDMEKKFNYFIDAKHWRNKLDACLKVLYDEQLIFKQAKVKLKLISPENDLSDATSLVDLPMSTSHIKSFSLLFLHLYRSSYYEVPVENIFEKINFENCLFAYEQFQEHKKIQERARKESENKASTLEVCFNDSVDQRLLELIPASLQFENNSLEEYQMYFDSLRISISETLKCLKELISLESSMASTMMIYLSQPRRQLLNAFVFLDEERLDVFTG